MEEEEVDCALAPFEDSQWDEPLCSKVKGSIVLLSSDCVDRLINLSLYSNHYWFFSLFVLPAIFDNHSIAVNDGNAIE